MKPKAQTLSIPLSVDQINRNFDCCIQEITGDQIINASTIGTSTTISIKVEALLALIPKAGRNLALIQISAPLTGARYTGTLLTGAPNNATLTGNYTGYDTGESAGNTTVIFENQAEANLGTNWIGNGTIVLGTPFGNGNLSGNATPIYRSECMVGATGNATALNASGINADTGNWSRSGNRTPLALTIQTRSYWDTTGAVLYGFSRVLNFDAAGVCISASAETRYTIDTTGNCTS